MPGRPEGLVLSGLVLNEVEGVEGFVTAGSTNFRTVRFFILSEVEGVEGLEIVSDEVDLGIRQKSYPTFLQNASPNPKRPRVTTRSFYILNPDVYCLI